MRKLSLWARRKFRTEIYRKIIASKFFDERWYLSKYPDVLDCAEGALAHFCMHGLYEHRDPGPNFDTHRYLAAVPDAGGSRLPPFLYALEHHVKEGAPFWLREDKDIFLYLLTASGLFEEAWYIDNNPDVARRNIAALEHYLNFGAAEFRDPGPNFDSEHYAFLYPHYKNDFQIPIEHYLRIGLYRGYSTIGVSKYERWLISNNETTEADLEILKSEQKTKIHAMYVHILGRSDGSNIASIVAALKNQVAVSWSACFLRGSDIGTAAWWSMRTRFIAEPRINFATQSRDIFTDLMDGSIVLLCAGVCKLRPHALYSFAKSLIHANADAAYSDHDLIDKEGTRSAPVFKPAMSQYFMRHVHYTGSVIALRVGPRTRPALAGAISALDDPERVWADLLLALDPARVLRIPLILYHVHRDGRTLETSGYQPVSTRSPASLTPVGTSSGRAVEAVPDRTATTHDFRRPEEQYDIHTQAGASCLGSSILSNSRGRMMSDAPSRTSRQFPKVRIVIPTRDRSTILKICIDSIIDTTDYPPDAYDIFVVDNNSIEKETTEYFDKMKSHHQFAIVNSPGIFNFSKLCNDGAAGADAEILIFLNNDMTVRQSNWLLKLVRHAEHPEIGVVGAQLLYPDGTVQHGGVVLGIDGVGGHALAELPAEAARALDSTREMSAVTGACLAVRRSVFEEIGGFDLSLRVDFNDVDLCCAALKAGYRNLYIAEPLLYHHESLSRGTEMSRAKRRRNAHEGILVRQRHADLIRDDPSYNPNLSLTKAGALAFPPRVIPPWRRPAGDACRVLLLCAGRKAGDGIARAVAEQATYLAGRGFEVIIGTPEAEEQEGNVARLGCRYVALDDPQAAAVFATREGLDAMIVYTAPYYAVTRHLGHRPFVYIVDHGDPPPNLFLDREAREDSILQKRFEAALAVRVFCTSVAAQDTFLGQDTILLPGGRAPLATWSDAWSARRPALREKFGLADRFVVLNLCRMGEAERAYNGFDDYVALANEYIFTNRTLAGRTLFVAADRGPIAYPADIAPTDLLLLGNLSDAHLADLFAASDLYVTTQLWQGADCGIAQARAMGLPVVARDSTLDRAPSVEIASTIAGFCRSISEQAERWLSGTAPRSAVLIPGSDPLALLADTIVRDIQSDRSASWI